MVGGYMGKILQVDLSAGSVRDEALDANLCRHYYGGYGIGAKLVYERQRPGVDPLSPENLLGFMTGPFTGTPALIGSRFMVFGKSPQTGTWGDSNCGGRFGPQMKFAGVDGFFVTGSSKNPVYLHIHDGGADLRDASRLWGKDCFETEEALKQELGAHVEVASIGPVGEAQSPMSAIITDKYRSAARSGFAAVMGAKRLKAVAAQGTMKVPVFDENAVKAISKRLLTGEKGGWYTTLQKYGTCGIVAHHAEYNNTPIKNWTGLGTPDGDFPPEKARKISDESVIAWQEKRYGCWGCPIRCGGLMKIDTGEFALPESQNYRGHKPEYETLGMLGTNLLNDSVECIIKLNDLCNQYGMDTIALGAVLGLALECYERGLVTKDDLGGIELVWGNASALLALSQKIIKQEGFGKVLAKGAKAAAETIGRGAESYAIHVHGREVPSHDPKYVPGMITTYFADACPANHVQGMEDWWPFGWGEERVPELVTFYQAKKPNTFPRWQYTERGGIHRKISAFRHVVNSVGACHFCDDSFPFAKTIPEFLNALTGWDVTFEEMLETGERIATVRHAFNLREGENFLEWDVNPRLIGNPPLPAGFLKGVTLDYRTMWREYLEAMDWDTSTAVPSRRALDRLGLGHMAKELGAK